MSKNDDIQELTQIAEHLEQFASMVDKQYTGFAHAALEIASQAVFHAVDLLHMAESRDLI